MKKHQKKRNFKIKKTTPKFLELTKRDDVDLIVELIGTEGAKKLFML